MSDPRGNVPFAWENKPGISKATTSSDRRRIAPAVAAIEDRRRFPTKLPLPPCPTADCARVSMAREMQIPLPPCTFQPPTRSGSKKGSKKQDDDPFLAAYMECTKGTKAGHRHKSSKHVDGGLGFGLRKHMLANFSCQQSCSVRDDNLIRVSHFEREKS
ncbi:uncharacterized protein LOC115746259 [Rhodamnia argentea]|uniref:Uncharacterized protein LOC115746259 n=1 Tax=Rhodamnia argentea TaxID=178133 RepID=A0ABM3H1W4_9MYRT|nr:uncharacterized protein LOC115746259 [Rhodamnia argentea]